MITVVPNAFLREWKLEPEVVLKQEPADDVDDDDDNDDDDDDDEQEEDEEEAGMTDVDEVFSCGFCQTTFGERERWAAHEMTHLQRFSCPTCAAAFTSMRSLRQHCNQKQHTMLPLP